MVLWWLEKNCERKNKMKQGEGPKSRNWQGRKRKLASTARGHERQHETTFLERVSRAEYTVPTSSFIWGQERTLSGVRISAEGKKPSPFMKAELSQVFLNVLFSLRMRIRKGFIYANSGFPPGQQRHFCTMDGVPGTWVHCAFSDPFWWEEDRVASGFGRWASLTCHSGSLVLGELNHTAHPRPVSSSCFVLCRDSSCGAAH